MDEYIWYPIEWTVVDCGLMADVPCFQVVAVQTREGGWWRTTASEGIPRHLRNQLWDPEAFWRRIGNFVGFVMRTWPEPTTAKPASRS